jgi:putative colanic acid biosynthesis acetyltransferase WcaB
MNTSAKQVSWPLQPTVEYVGQDWRVNAGNPKFRAFMLFFRVCQMARRRAPGKSGKVVDLLYRLVSESIFALEVPLRCRIGPGLRVYHGFGIVINDAVAIGRDVTLRNGVVIGHREPHGAVPALEDGVDVGASACILGGVRIGRGARIGAGAVVLRDVPARSVAYGNPAKLGGEVL